MKTYEEILANEPVTITIQKTSTLHEIQVVTESFGAKLSINKLSYLMREWQVHTSCIQPQGTVEWVASPSKGLKIGISRIQRQLTALNAAIIRAEDLYNSLPEEE